MNYIHNNINKYYKRSSISLALLFSFLPNPSVASTSKFGSISAVNIIKAGKLFFSVSGARTTAPSCATQNRWVIDVSTPIGQAEAAVFLTALAQKQMISVVGSANCADWGDTESVETLSISN